MQSSIEIPEISRLFALMLVLSRTAWVWTNLPAKLFRKL